MQENLTTDFNECLYLLTYQFLFVNISNFGKASSHFKINLDTDFSLYHKSYSAMLCV